MGKTYCSSDWHGYWDIAKQILDYLEPDDTLYFLGDAADRGPDGVKIIQAIIEDPRIKMIMGNHDEMMHDAIRYIDNNYSNFDCSLWAINGGNSTYDALLNLTKEERNKIALFIEHLPLTYFYNSLKGNIIMEHAGYTPYSPYLKRHEPLWDRTHFDDDWPNKEDAKNVYIIHGHTPVQYLKFYYGCNGCPTLTKEEMEAKLLFKNNLPNETWKPTILHYCDGHKIDLDMCTIDSGRIALLNLDTFEEIYFDRKEND